MSNNRFLIVILLMTSQLGQCSNKRADDELQKIRKYNCLQNNRDHKFDDDGIEIEESARRQLRSKSKPYYYLSKNIYRNLKLKPCESNRPKLVIQGGPSKTGSSFMQTLLSSPESREILEKDNYLYVGRCYPDLYEETTPCYNEVHSPFFQSGTTNLVPEIKFMLDKMKQENRNGLLVQEAVGKFMRDLAPYFTDFDVYAVLTYRRKFDKLPSKYGQTNLDKEKHSSACGNVAPPPFEIFAFATRKELESIGIRSRKCQQHWLGLWKTYSRFDNASNHLFAKSGVVSLQWTDVHANHDDSTGSNLLVELFCTDAVPGSDYSCKAAKEDKFVGKPLSNSRHRVDFIILAYKAKAKGLISQCRDQWVFLDHMNNVDLSFYPTICMSKEKLVKLHDFSWQNEIHVFPERDGDEYFKQLHRDAFDREVKEGKYCSLDTDFAIEDEKMQNIILSWGM